MLWDIIEPCWDLEPEKRPTAQSIYTSLQTLVGRPGVDEDLLALAFGPESYHPNNLLLEFLVLIRRSSFYLNDQLEPVFRSTEGKQLISQLKYDSNPEVVSDTGPFVDVLSTLNAARTYNRLFYIYGGSIYKLLMEDMCCLICGKNNNFKYDDPVAHIRAHLGHQPFRCTCRKCTSSDRYLPQIIPFFTS